MKKIMPHKLSRAILLTLTLSAPVFITGCDGNNEKPAVQAADSTSAGAVKNTSVQKTSGTENQAGKEAEKSSSEQAAVPEKRTIKIAYLPITHAVPGMELADISQKKDLGFDVELIRFSSWTDLIDALNAGKVDAAFSLVELIMKAKEQGVDVSLAALAHHDGNVVVIGNNYTSMADIKGKTFAIPHRQSTHYILLNDALAKEGLTIDDIKITEMAPPEMPAALASNQIAGYCVAEPFGARAVSLNLGKVLYQSHELWPDSVCCGLALNNKFLAEHPELAQKLVDAVKEAGAHLDADHEHSIEVLTRNLNAPKEILELSLKWISFSNLDITREQYESLREKVVKYGLSENPPAYEDIVINVK